MTSRYARPWMQLLLAVATSGSIGAALGHWETARTATHQTHHSAQTAYYEDLSKRVDTYAARLEGLEAKNYSLTLQNVALVASRATDRERIAELTQRVKCLETEVRRLRAAQESLAAQALVRLASRRWR